MSKKKIRVSGDENKRALENDEGKGFLKPPVYCNTQSTANWYAQGRQAEHLKKKAKKPAEVVKLSFSRKGSRSSHCGISIFMTNDGALLALQTVDPMKFLSDYYCCSRPPPSNLRK